MKNTIHYAFILDQSGSMQSLKQEVVSSYNEQVEAIKKLKKSNPDSEIKFTLCVFNDVIEFRFTNKQIDKLKPLKSHQYKPDSCTALYDALGTTLKKVNEQAIPDDKVFVAIFTDGLENASTDFSSKDLRKLLAQAEEKKWEIRFFCQQAENLFYKSHLGIADNQMMNISLNEAGFKVMENEITYCLSQMVNTQKK
jgi:hypothetical protein